MEIPQVQKPFGITPAYDILLRGSEQMPIGLYHLYIARAAQVCRLHYSMGSLKGVQAKFRVLCDQGYVQFDAMPTKRMRSPYYYALDHLGIHYLQEVGIDVSGAFRADKEVNKNYLFVEHTLELNDILIAAALLKRSNPNYWLESFTHERDMKRKPYKAKWQGGSFTLIPDAFLTFRMIVPDGRQRRMPIIIEHDRGTEEQHYFRRRIRAYNMMLRSKEMFQVGGVTIAFSTSAGVERLKRMLEWTRRELADEPRAISNTFYFTSFPKQPTDPRQTWLEPCQIWLQPCWYTPYSEQPIALLTGV